MASATLSNLKPAKGATRRVKRIGRGQGSGHGGTSTRGHKGQRSRSGNKYHAWFEGGQMPLARRIPKFGFHNPFRVEYQAVNVSTLEKLSAEGKIEGGKVTPEILYTLGVVSKKTTPVKILGDGNLKAKLDITAHAFSKSAAQKIEAAGGTMQTISKMTN